MLDPPPLIGCISMAVGRQEHLEDLSYLVNRCLLAAIALKSCRPLLRVYPVPEVVKPEIGIGLLPKP